jgi:heme O synthase-like polyprenyltransferase
MLEPGAIYLFMLLFLWQLPHFLAINWMYRDEYRKGGFVMLANEDEHGAKTSRHALAYAIATLLLMLYPAYTATVSLVWFLPPALLLSGWLGWLALRFNRQPERASARKLFFCTLAYLPLILIVTVLAWKR